MTPPGYVHHAAKLGFDGAFTVCQLTFSSWLHFLKHRKDARIWQDKSADDILQEVFNHHPEARGRFRFDLERPAVSRSYCTQVETDWHFVMRLMEEGWTCYHEQQADGKDHNLLPGQRSCWCRRFSFFDRQNRRIAVDEVCLSSRNTLLHQTDNSNVIHRVKYITRKKGGT